MRESVPVRRRDKQDSKAMLISNHFGQKGHKAQECTGAQRTETVRYLLPKFSSEKFKL